MNLGGNKISKIRNNKLNINYILSNNKNYYYEFIKTKKLKQKSYSNLRDACVYVLNCDKKSFLKYENISFSLKPGTCITIQNYNFEIHATNVEIFITGKYINKSIQKSFIPISKSNIYKVNKPWGYEQWLTGKNNSNFCFKKIFLKEGNKTSLQYHNFKKETNFLYNGKIKLHFFSNKFNKKNFDKKYISSKILNKFSIIDVIPPIIHRIESVSDTELFEVSTPHLDDVIRLEDVTNRLDGKINSEHKKN